MKAKVKTWLRNIENGRIRNNTERILYEIKSCTPNAFIIDDKRKGISTDDLRSSLEIPHQSLTAVLSMLSDEGLIDAVSQVDQNESTYSIYMFIYDLKYRERLIYLRKKEKFVQWLKKADMYEEFLNQNTIRELNEERKVMEIELINQEK